MQVFDSSLEIKKNLRNIYKQYESWNKKSHLFLIILNFPPFDVVLRIFEHEGQQTTV